MKKKEYKVAVEASNNIEKAIIKGLEEVRYKQILKKDDTIFLKPNLTWQIYKPGVTTSPSVLESTIKILQKRCKHIIVGESTAARHAWESESCFKGHGIDQICKNYGVELVNLSKKPMITKSVSVCGERIRLKVSKFILDRIDKFVTLPVMKCHVATYVTLSLKNQWGAIPDPNRLLYHPFLHKGIVAINKIYNPDLVIMDCLYGLDGPGPIHGNPIPVNRIICGNNPVATDLFTINYMKINPSLVKHLKLAIDDGLGPRSLDEIQIIGENEGTHKFRMYRTLYDRIAVFVMYHKAVNDFVYASHWSKHIDLVLNIFRKLIGSKESY